MKEIPEDTKEIQKNYSIEKLKDLLYEELKKTYDVLDECLQDLFRNPNIKKFHEVKVPGYQFSIISNDNKKRLSFARRGGEGRNDMKLYQWLTLDYFWNDQHVRSYCLGLCREDLDTETGNIHQDFTKLQMSRCNFLKSEFFSSGGENTVNPPHLTRLEDEEIKLLKVKDRDKNDRSVADLIFDHKDVKPDIYKHYYIASNSFPSATLDTINNDCKPWGYDNFVFNYGHEKISARQMSTEIMDLTKNYDPKKVASFFLQLCAYDVEMCYKK